MQAESSENATAELFAPITKTIRESEELSSRGDTSDDEIHALEERVAKAEQKTQLLRQIQQLEQE